MLKTGRSILVSNSNIEEWLRYLIHFLWIITFSILGFVINVRQSWKHKNLPRVVLLPVRSVCNGKFVAARGLERKGSLSWRLGHRMTLTGPTICQFSCATTRAWLRLHAHLKPVYLPLVVWFILLSHVTWVWTI